MGVRNIPRVWGKPKELKKKPWFQKWWPYPGVEVGVKMAGDWAKK